MEPRDLSRWEAFALVSALQRRQGLAGDSPEGATKATRGGWDVTSAGEAAETVRETGEMRRDP